MWLRLPALLCAVLAGWCCAPSVPLSRGDLERLGSVDRIPVVFRRASAPWVDCPGDDGRKLWELPGGADVREPPGAAPWIQAALPGFPPRDLAAAGWVIPAGDIWEDYLDEWTKSLQTPPEDPVRATGRMFLADARAASGPLPLAAELEEVQSTATGALAARFGQRPVLVLRATRWLLVGCFFTFKPWFNVSATLVDLPSGKVLWRDECAPAYPGGDRREASPGDLEANDRALYRQVIESRAAQCASGLLDALTRR